MRRPAILLLSLCLGACAGPDLLTDGHLAYNEAVRSSADRELLLNIVRASHGDTIEFLSTASINSTVRFSAGLTGGYEHETTNEILSTGVSFGYSGGPTFTFVPQRGSDFAASLTKPVEVPQLITLAASCPDLEPVLQLLLVRLNGLENKSTSIGREFLTAIGTLAELERRGRLVLGFAEESEVVSPPMKADSISPSIVLDAIRADLRVETQQDATQVAFVRSSPKSVLYVSGDDELWTKLASTLHLSTGRKWYHLKLGEPAGEDGTLQDAISIRTRSLLEVLIYLSLGVERGRRLQRSEDEERVAELVRSILHVRRTESEPDDAMLSVPYGGAWYSIAGDDERSRRTFFLLATAFRFGLEDQADAAPDLNLVIGS